MKQTALIHVFLHLLAHASAVQLGRSVKQASEHDFDQSELTDTALQILPRFKKRCLPMGYHAAGVWYSEGLALASAAVLAKVDVILESGTAGGQSTELLARFFEGSPLQIFTIDLGGKAAEANLTATKKRLARFTQVHFIQGDGNIEVPKLIKKFSGKRVGVFVDGPKAWWAVKLCMASIKSSSDVKYCSMHDISPSAWGAEFAAAVEDWGRTRLLTWKPQWRQRFGSLDKDKPGLWGNTTYGWGVSIQAGLSYAPWGSAEGDDGKTLPAGVLD